MDKNVFAFSEHGSKEYSASIVRIGELHSIEGSDFLAKTVVDGEDIVVRKDEVTPGDLMIYARIETVLDSGFLSVNNLYEWSEKERNQNYPEVLDLINSGKEDEAKRKVGFFNKHGRVKMIKLRGCPSKGFLFKKDALVKWNPSLKNKKFELENNMDVSKEEESTKEVSEIDESIFPMYIPENTKLTNTETVSLDDGERVIMTFEGDSPFMFIKQTASTSDKLVIESVYGEPYQIATGVAAVSDNMITWTSNGLEYYVVSEKMSDEELVSVASSLATMPVSK